MPDFEIIDVHTHTFSTPQRGVGWQRSIGHANPARSGTTDELLGLMRQAGISHSVMLMYTPTRFMYESRLRHESVPSDPGERAKLERGIKDLMVQRMIENNEWACAESRKHAELINFTGLDPVYMDEQTLLGEIDDKVKKGAKGVKIVPLALAIYGNDRRLWPVYDKISKLGLPMLSQSGGHSDNGNDAWGRPKYFAEALADFPDLKLIFAHLGHGYEDDVVELCGRFPNLYADLSTRLHTLDQPDEFSTEGLVEFIRKCGAEHIMFGTNYPMNDPVLYAKVLRDLPLSDDEKLMIASGNAKRVISIG